MSAEAFFFSTQVDSKNHVTSNEKFSVNRESNYFNKRRDVCNKFHKIV